jgi:Uma2 family endonuclease
MPTMNEVTAEAVLERVPMATMDEFALAPFETPRFPVRRFTVEEYQKLGEIGLLTEDDQVELIEGWIVPKMNRNPLHDATIEIIQDWLAGVLPKGWRYRVQSGIVTRDSQPEPDLVVVRGDPRERRNRHPNPEDLSLVIEVADSSLRFDREDKARLYARGRVPCYWIVNLIDKQIEVLTDPTGPRRKPVFHKQEIFQLDDEVSLMIEGQFVARTPVASLLA